MTLDRLTIRLPWPDTSLMANRRNGKHWLSSHGAKVRARETAFFAAKEALGRNSFVVAGQMPVSITWVAPNKVRRDLDGLLSAEKPRLDGIAAALGIDDSQFTPLTLDRALDAEKKGFVLVQIGE
jgi:crossover junction endodeoxyribonuclease RusA